MSSIEYWQEERHKVLDYAAFEVLQNMRFAFEKMNLSREVDYEINDDATMLTFTIDGHITQFFYEVVEKEGSSFVYGYLMYHLGKRTEFNRLAKTVLGDGYTKE